MNWPKSVPCSSKMASPGPPHQFEIALARLRRHGNVIAFDICCDAASPDVGLELTSGRYGHLTCASRHWPMRLKKLAWTNSEGESFNFAVDASNVVDVITQLIFMTMHTKSCVLVTHHMEWKAFVVERALHEHGLPFLASVWAKLAEDGLCLMSPNMCSLRHGGRAHYTAVGRLCETFLDHGKRKEARPPSGERAKLFWLIARGVERALLPPCAFDPEAHVYVTTPVTGPRDNGEREYVCTLCGVRRA